MLLFGESASYVTIKSMNEVTLIPAQATPDHARRFAQLAQIAGDDIYRELFGEKASAVLESMFMQANNDSSYSYASFLQVDDEIAGMLVAYAAEEARSHAKRTTWLMLRYAGLQSLRFLAVSVLLGDMLGFLGSNLEADDFYIAMVAIYQRYRRRGHSKDLLNHAGRLAVQRGSSRLALDVDERNRIAIAAYHRAGFVQIDESKKIQHQGERWGLLRLAKPV